MVTTIPVVEGESGGSTINIPRG